MAKKVSKEDIQRLEGWMTVDEVAYALDHSNVAIRKKVWHGNIPLIYIRRIGKSMLLFSTEYIEMLPRFRAVAKSRLRKAESEAESEAQKLMDSVQWDI